MSLNDTTKNKGRDAKGRFAEGNPGASGNPYTRQTALLRQAVLDELNETEIRIIVQRLKALAVGGDLQAIKLVLAYAVGKPENAVNPTRWTGWSGSCASASACRLARWSAWPSACRPARPTRWPPPPPRPSPCSAASTSWSG